MKQLTYSLSAILEGFAYTLSNPKLYKFIIIAIITNIIVTTILVISLSFGIDWFIESMIALLPFSIPSLLETILDVVSFILSLILVSLLFNSISMLVNSVVYGEMTEVVLDLENISDETHKLKYLQPIKEITSAIGFEGKKLFISLFFLFFSFLFILIPIIGGIISPVLSIFGTIFFNSLDLFDPVLGRKNYSFRDKIKYVTGNPLSVWPFAFIAGTLNSVPVLNIITQPFSIVGSVLLYIHIEKLRLQ
jgi:uncharacterized protein involved in cysteine biosynthesis